MTHCLRGARAARSLDTALMTQPLTRPSATLSPLTRGEGGQMTIAARRQSGCPFLRSCGEKVPEGRMRGRCHCLAAKTSRGSG